MFVSNCPRCNEALRVPGGGFPDGAHAQCPWCRETFPLAEILDHLPPVLQIVTADGHPIESVLELISKNGLGHATVSDFTRSAETISDDEIFEDLNADDDAHGSRSSTKMVAAEIVTKDSWNFDEDTAQDDFQSAQLSSYPVISPARSNGIDPMGVMPVPVRRRKKGSGFRTAIGVVLGGLLAVPLAGGLLTLLGRPPDWGFWPFDNSGDSPPSITAATPGLVSERDRAGFDPSFSTAGQPLGQSLSSSNDDIPAADEDQNIHTDPQQSVLDEILLGSRSSGEETDDEAALSDETSDPPIEDSLPSLTDPGADQPIAEQEDAQPESDQEESGLLLPPEIDDLANAEPSTTPIETEVMEPSDEPFESLIPDDQPAGDSIAASQPPIKILEDDSSGDQEGSVDDAPGAEDPADTTALVDAILGVPDESDLGGDTVVSDTVEMDDPGEDDLAVPSIDTPTDVPNSASSADSSEQPDLNVQPVASPTEVVEPASLTQSSGQADESEGKSTTLQPPVEPKLSRDPPQVLARVESAGEMVNKLASFAGTEVERRRLLARTYQEVARACEQAPRDSEAIRKLAVKIAGSPEVVRDVELAGLEWLQYRARTTEGAALVGRPGAGDEGPIMTLRSGQVVKVTGTGSLPSTAKVLALGKIVGDNAVELVVAEGLP